jgi:hypothetical protein
MKKVMALFVAGACMLSAATISTQAFAQTPAPEKAKVEHKKPVAKKKVEKKSERRVIHRKPVRKGAVAAAAALPMLAGAEKWSCDDSESMDIAGNMQRDQILTMRWKGRDYKLPRVPTTTGADRFYDAASGMDLVVIPVKAMLFDDHGDRTRLADECKTQLMAEQNAPAPTQSNALIRK